MNETQAVDAGRKRPHAMKHEILLRSVLLAVGLWLHREIGDWSSTQQTEIPQFCQINSSLVLAFSLTGSQGYTKACKAGRHCG